MTARFVQSHSFKRKKRVQAPKFIYGKRKNVFRSGAAREVCGKEYSLPPASREALRTEARNTASADSSP